MTERCKVCRNLDPNDPVYGSIWTSGAVFQHSYIALIHIINGPSLGCIYCSLLSNLVREFVSQWKAKADKISLHVTAPVGRPLVAQINESIDPSKQMDELCTVSVSILSGMILVPVFRST